MISYCEVSECPFLPDCNQYTNLKCIIDNYNIRFSEKVSKQIDKSNKKNTKKKRKLED